MMTLYFIKGYSCYNAHEQASLSDAEAQALIRAGIAHPAASAEARAARAAHTPQQGDIQPRREIWTDARAAEIAAWFKG